MLQSVGDISDTVREYSKFVPSRGTSRAESGPGGASPLSTSPLLGFFPPPLSATGMVGDVV